MCMDFVKKWWRKLYHGRFFYMLHCVVHQVQCNTHKFIWCRILGTGFGMETIKFPKPVLSRSTHTKGEECTFYTKNTIHLSFNEAISFLNHLIKVHVFTNFNFATWFEAFVLAFSSSAALERACSLCSWDFSFLAKWIFINSLSHPIQMCLLATCINKNFNALI